MTVWREEAIGRLHDRTGFDCGVAPLNQYLARYARQNHQSGGAKTYIAATDAEPSRILGYYSVSPALLAFARTPEALRHGLGRYNVPGFRLARLAVSRALQGRGLGSWLFAAAAERCAQVADAVGGVLLLIDAKDEAAAAWYRRFGAVPLADAPLTLAFPLSLVAAARKRL